jgi:hypothetical protein
LKRSAPAAKTPAIAQSVGAVSAAAESYLPTQTIEAPPATYTGVMHESANLLESGSPAEPAMSSEQPEQVFKGRILWQVVACLCAVVCFGIVAVAVSQYDNPHARHPPTRSTVLGLCGLFGLSGLVSLFVAFKIGGLKYVVYPDRVVVGRGGSANSYRWDQIRAVFHSVHPVWQTYKIVTRKGQTYKLTGDIQRHKELGDLISERVAEQLLPETLRELETGRSVALGPLRLSGGGVDLNGEHVPWLHMQTLTYGLNPRAVKGNMVSNMIHVRLGGSMVELSEIPNYRLFEKLVRHFHPACLLPEATAS